MARPWPEILPPEYLMRESALCPQITPGMAAKIEKQARLKMPSTRLQMASAEVFGGDVSSNAGGMVSFIIICFQGGTAWASLFFLSAGSQTLSAPPIK